MKQSNLCQNFAGWSKQLFLTASTLHMPFFSKEVIHSTLSVGVLVGYKGLKWIWYFHINHTLRIAELLA
jgi:hypothetical protein